MQKVEEEFGQIRKYLAAMQCQRDVKWQGH
jgi:hypothetical protein